MERWIRLSKSENGLDPSDPSHLLLLRAALLDFIADFANWDNSTVKEYLETGRALTQAPSGPVFQRVQLSKSI